jgi:anti-sigma factor RsiW
MNNSESNLSAMEEKLTAYLDGKLSPAEAAAFERENPDVLVERQNHEALRAVLAKDTTHLKNGDFFNHQILREIGADAPRPAREKAAIFPLWRLAFAGAACLVAAAGIYFAFVGEQKATGRNYFAQVLSVKAGDEELSARLIDADGVAVVWIDGLDSLSTDYVLE